MKKIFKSQLAIPLITLLLLALYNLIRDPGFFALKIVVTSTGNKVIQGNLISILDYGSTLAILAIGMTLVTSATGGQDISVGAAVAIGGSVILRVVCGPNAMYQTMQQPLILAFLLACVVCMIFGAFNGVLVAIFRIQPMIATLILFTAGRSIAAWINNNMLPTVTNPEFGYWGNYIPGIPIPTPILVGIVCMIVIALVLKFTTLGLYTQAVGINENSSKLNGINPVIVKIITFVILGLCVAVVALIYVSRVSQINYSSIAKDIEMDAILAVALGGNSLSGGKFNIWASILGAYVIQFLTTTLYRYNVESEALPAYKAVVVIILVIVSAPAVKTKAQEIIAKIKNSKKAGKEVA